MPNWPSCSLVTFLPFSYTPVSQINRVKPLSLISQHKLIYRSTGYIYDINIIFYYFCCTISNSHGRFMYTLVAVNLVSYFFLYPIVMITFYKENVLNFIFRSPNPMVAIAQRKIILQQAFVTNKRLSRSRVDQQQQPMIIGEFHRIFIFHSYGQLLVSINTWVFFVLHFSISLCKRSA